MFTEDLTSGKLVLEVHLNKDVVPTLADISVKCFSLLFFVLLNEFCCKLKVYCACLCVVFTRTV